VQARVKTIMGQLDSTFEHAQQKRFHADFLAELFDPADATVQSRLRALPGAQQAFFRDIGGGTLGLVEASGFGRDARKENRSSDVTLRWDFEDDVDDRGLLCIEFNEGHDGGLPYYDAIDIYSLIDGEVTKTWGDTAAFLIDRVNTSGIGADVDDDLRCFYARHALPVFGDWATELTPTKEESANAFKYALMRNKPKQAIELMDIYSHRHGEIMDHDGRHSLIFAARMNEPAEVMRRLVSDGAKIDLPDDSGKTPLAQAAWSHNMEAVEVLLSLGASASKGLKLYQENEGGLGGGSPPLRALLEKALLSEGHNKQRNDPGFGL